MKILLISSCIDPQSGAGRYACSVARGFLGRGVNFIVATEYRNEKGGPYHRPILLPRTSFLNVIRNVVRIRSIVKKEKIDLIHALDGWPYGVYGYLALLGTKKKLVISGVGTYSIIPRSSFIKNALMRHMYRCAQSVVCISNYTKD